MERRIISRAFSVLALVCRASVEHGNRFGCANRPTTALAQPAFVDRAVLQASRALPALAA
ncbi:hypothetical protein [Rhodobacter lacus]|uniref:Uncharacterized protein n=1 Tax=Rhodobacter lacus TaxID=1641972 RepID=A0ABW5ABY7_9RHOB